MSLSLRNRQFAGNICLVLFLAFMFTLLPGQLWNDNAYAAVPEPQVVVNTGSNNAAIADANTATYTITGVTDAIFASSWTALVADLAGSYVHDAVYQVTYRANGIINAIVYLVYDNASDKVQDTYDFVYDKDTNGLPTATSVMTVWRPPTNSGNHDNSTTPTTPVPTPTPTPTTPVPTTTPVAKVATYQPTVVQVKVLNTINKDLQGDKFIKNAPQANNVVVTTGKHKISIPKLVVTSSKVVIIMPLTSTKLDPKAVNYKIGVVKAYLAAQGITNVPVRIVFLNADPKLKVSVKPGSYYSVVTEGNLAKAVSSTGANKALVAAKAKIIKAFSIKVAKPVK